jgi:hypothetical protein
MEASLPPGQPELGVHKHSIGPEGEPAGRNNSLLSYLKRVCGYGK